MDRRPGPPGWRFTLASGLAACIVATLVTGNLWWLAGAVVAGYGFAWIGHFAFEKNRPATFKHPVYSLMGDWRMYWQIVSRQIPF